MLVEEGGDGLGEEAAGSFWKLQEQVERGVQTMLGTWAYYRTAVLLQEGKRKSVTRGGNGRVGGTYQVFILFLHLQHCLFLPEHQDKVVHVLLTQLKHHCLQVRRVGEDGGGRASTRGVSSHCI